MLCCDKYYNLGCVTNCEKIVLPILSDGGGDYLVKYSYLNTSVDHFFVQENIIDGENIHFDNYFNENDVIYFQITDPSGNLINIDGYECFYITISPGRLHENIETCSCDFDVTEQVALSYDYYKVYKIDIIEGCDYDIYGYKITYNSITITTNSDFFAINFGSGGTFQLTIQPLTFNCNINSFIYDAIV